MPDSRSMNSTPNLSHDKLNIDAKEEVVLQSPPTISNFVTDPLQWSVDEVSAWVESTLGFEGPKYATCFLKAAIDGRTLLSMVRRVYVGIVIIPGEFIMHRAGICMHVVHILEQ